MADFPFIIGPRQVHGARTPEEFLYEQSKHIGERSVRGLIPASVVPHAVTATEATPFPVPYIAHRGWMLLCSCNGGVSVSPEWDLACCFECGAIYRGLDFPADRLEIERILLKRPGARRFWNAPDTTDKQGVRCIGVETCHTLRAENREHGWEVPA